MSAMAVIDSCELLLWYWPFSAVAALLLERCAALTETNASDVACLVHQD